MHDIYPFLLPRREGEDLWRQFMSANYEALCEKYGRRAYTGCTPGGYEMSFSWHEIDVIVQSPIRVEFAVYDMLSPYAGGRGDLIAEISHSYSDTTLYPHINEQQLRIAGQVLAERERLAAARELEQKIAAVHLELFGELPCESIG